MLQVLNAPEISGDDVTSVAQTIKGMSLFDVLKFAVLVIVLIILVKLLTSLMSRIITRSKIDKSAHSFLLSIVKGVLWFIAITILASSLGVDITSLIAILSVAGLAVSLALSTAHSSLYCRRILSKSFSRTVCAFEGSAACLSSFMTLSFSVSRICIISMSFPHRIHNKASRIQIK